MNKFSTDKDLSMDILNSKLSIDNKRSIRRQYDRESKVQSGADMAAESEFVDPCVFLENRSMSDIQNHFENAYKRFNMSWTSNNQV